MSEDVVQSESHDMSKLPLHLLTLCLEFLDPSHLVVVSLTNKAFHIACNETTLWQAWFDRAFKLSIPEQLLNSHEDDDNENLELVKYAEETKTELPWRATFKSRAMVRQWVLARHNLRAKVKASAVNLTPMQHAMSASEIVVPQFSLDEVKEDDISASNGAAPKLSAEEGKEFVIDEKSESQKGPDLKVFPTGNQRVTCMKFDNTKLCFSSGGRAIRVFSMYDGRKLGVFPSKQDNITCLDFNTKMLISGHSDRTVRVYDWDTFSLLTVTNKKNRHTLSITAAKLLQRSDHMLSTSLDGTLKQWTCGQGHDGTCVRTFSNHEDDRQNRRGLLCMDAFTDQEFVTGSLGSTDISRPGYLGVWDARVGDYAPVASCDVGSVSIRSVMVNRASTHLVATGGDDGRIRLFDIRYLSESTPAWISSTRQTMVNDGQRVRGITSLHFHEDRLLACRDDAFSVFQTQTGPGLYPTHMYRAFDDKKMQLGAMAASYCTNSFICNRDSGIPVAYELNHFMRGDAQRVVNSAPKQKFEDFTRSIPEELTFDQVYVDEKTNVMALSTTSFVAVWGACAALEADTSFRPEIYDEDVQVDTPYKSRKAAKAAARGEAKDAKKEPKSKKKVYAATQKKRWGGNRRNGGHR